MVTPLRVANKRRKTPSLPQQLVVPLSPGHSRDERHGRDEHSHPLTICSTLLEVTSPRRENILIISSGVGANSNLFRNLWECPILNRVSDGSRLLVGLSRRRKSSFVLQHDIASYRAIYCLFYWLKDS